MIKTNWLPRFAVLSLFLIVGFTFAAPAFASTGAIFTTDVACDGTNVNLFADKDAVYLDGGPQHEGSAGLDEGDYYVKVTVPNGDLLGSTSGASVHVDASGNFATCYQLSTILVKASDSTPGYDDTTNGGGEYKVWISKNADFSGGSNKTDNFKVAGDPVVQPGHLIVNKVTDPANDPTTFSVTLGSEPVTGSATQDITTSTPVDYTVVAGTYSVTETSIDGWEKNDSDCQNVEVAAGATVECTIVNSKWGTWDVTKVVVVDNGGQEVATDFSFVVHVVDGPTSTVQFNATDDELVGFNQIPVSPSALVYVTEAPHFGYTSTLSAGCGTVENPVQVAVNSSADCTITNDDIQPKITVQKTVINNNGGQLHAGNFSFSVNGDLATSFTTDVNDITGLTGVNVLSVNAGTYNITETSSIGYASTVSGNCSNLNLHVGEEATCTFTNNDIPPVLHLIKNVINDNNGTAQATAWTLTATGTSSISGQGTADSGDTFQAGTYALAESGGPSGYAASAWSCTGNGAQSGATVTLGIGQSETCTITNNDIPITRTLGFWQTHTTFTSSIFGLAPMYIGVSSSPVPGSHKGTITNTQTTGASQLFGAYYAGISKLANGKTSRSAVDQARMQLLQQLVSAKLNCRIGICNAATNTLIAAADTAYNTGAANILSLASQLDTYNNSGDAQPIPSTFPAQGSATSQTSQKLANLAFWDTP